MGSNQHDTNFKQLMSNQTFFEGFLKTYLPRELLIKLDWSSIKFYKMGGQHVENSTQKTFESDLVYLADFETEPQMLWIHLEHQSKPDRRMPLRILNYQTAELLAYAKKNPKQKKLPGIISLIYHQGVRPWTYSLDLKDQFKDLNFYKKYFSKPFLIDLPAIPDEELRNHQNIGPVEVILKYVKQQTLELKFRKLISDLHAVDDSSKTITLKYVIDFLSLPDEEVIKIIHECLPESEGIVMNVKEQWFQQGIQHGIQQGMQEGIRQNQEDIARSMLLRGLNGQLIQEITHLSSEELNNLKQKIQH
jgi:predicted transposase/invertase (TIGR01784 family)